MPIDPITGGALIGAASSIGTNILNQTSSRRANHRNVANWKMQNEYNSPKAQMQRLQEAGLNPNLIYGDSVSGATGKADGVANVSPAQVDNPMDSISRYSQSRTSTAQYDLLQNQIDTEKERKRLTANQADKAYFDAANVNYSDTNNQYTQAVLQGLKVRNMSEAENVEMKTYLNQIKSQTVKAEVSRIIQEAQSAKAKFDGQILNNRLNQLQTEFLKLGVDRNAPWYAKMGAALFNSFTKTFK